MAGNHQEEPEPDQNAAIRLDREPLPGWHLHSGHRPLQKDVSQLLHAPIHSVYNLVKQLAKIFPVYFNQIGAEGQLRAVSTTDELTGRSDRSFISAQAEPRGEQQHRGDLHRGHHRVLAQPGQEPSRAPGSRRDLPGDRDLGPLVDEVHQIFVSIFRSGKVHQIKDLLDLPEPEIEALIGAVPQISKGSVIVRSS